MTLRRMAVLLTLAIGLAGCGPNTPAGGGGADGGKLEGVWMATKVEVPAGEPGPKDDELGDFVLSVKGNLITARKKGEAKAQYLVFEVDDKANPKTITFIESDEKAETGPVKRMTYPTALKEGEIPKPVEKEVPRAKLKGIYTLDGDTAKVAITTGPDLPPPSDFTPKAPAKKWGDAGATPADLAGVVVLHLTRQKGEPAWVNEPVPERPTPTTKAMKK